eukprot:2477549-Rhodomonas_salina.1
MEEQSFEISEAEYLNGVKHVKYNCTHDNYACIRVNISKLDASGNKYVHFRSIGLYKILQRAICILWRNKWDNRWDRWILINIEMPEGDYEFECDTNVDHVIITDPSKTNEEFVARYEAMLKDHNWKKEPFLQFGETLANPVRGMLFGPFYYICGLLLMHDPQQWLDFQRDLYEENEYEREKSKIVYNTTNWDKKCKYLRIYQKLGKKYIQRRSCCLKEFLEQSKYVLLHDESNDTYQKFIVVDMFLPQGEYIFGDDGSKSIISIQNLPINRNEFRQRYRELSQLPGWSPVNN